MKWRSGVALIAVMTGVGLLKVWQQTSVALSAYELGRRQAQVHALENETLWLDAQVGRLRSPSALAHAMDRQKLKLVAWSRMAGKARNSGAEQ